MATRAKLALIISLFGAAAAFSAAAADDFDGRLRKITDEILQAAKTHAERTARFHEAAGKAKDTRMQVALLQKVVEYGKKAKPAWALNLARKSLDLLEQKAPERADDWTARRIELYRRGFERLSSKSKNRRVLGERLVVLLLARGARCERQHRWQAAAAAYRDAKFPAYTLGLPNKEEISRKHVRAAHLAGVQRNAAHQKQRLARDRQDAAARLFLLKALVTELNSPRQAMTYLTEDTDEVWRTYVPLAARPAGELKPAACRELGDWYRKLAGEAASDYAKASMLARAQAYYEHLLKKKADDLVGKVALVQVKGELAKLDAEPVQPAPARPAPKGPSPG